MAMTDITVQRIYGSNRPGKKPKGVTSRYVTTTNGDKVRIYSIDAKASTFSEDFLYVFSKSVQAARKENKRLLGSYDGVKPDSGSPQSR